MKSKFTFVYSLLALFFTGAIFLSFSSFPPNGRTGAPGDGACNGCHFGGTQTGSVDIEGITDNPIVPSKTYNVTIRIRLTSGSSSRAGFEFVALDGNTNTSASTGSISNLGTNVTTSTTGSRTYAKHGGSENTYSSGEATYTFDWTAPATSTDDISFYAVGLIANGSGTGGDLTVFDADVSIPLPVELIEFHADNAAAAGVQLRWSTATEKNSDYFDVMRSENGRDYEPIGQVSAAGFSDELQFYSFRDESPVLNRNSFYRLKQVDLDGRVSYSPIEVVQAMNFKKRHLNVFPNPARNNECLFVDFMSETDQADAVVRIFDIYGRSVFEDAQMNAGVKKGFNKFVLDIKELPVGQYYLNISNGKDWQESRSFVVGR